MAGGSGLRQSSFLLRFVVDVPGERGLRWHKKRSRDAGMRVGF